MGRKSNVELEGTLGKIIGLIKFSGTLNTEDSRELDPEFTNEEKAHHWLVEGVIRLDVTHHLDIRKFIEFYPFFTNRQIFRKMREPLAPSYNYSEIA